MEWYEILLVIVGGILILLVMAQAYKKFRYKKVIDRVVEVIKSQYDDIDFATFGQGYDHHIEFFSGKRYLIKIIDMIPTYELIVTNSDKVVINDDIKNWRRSTKPHFVPGMEAFIAYERNSKDLVKIVLVYPGCHNITKYINECDAHVVDKFKPVDGLYFVRFLELKEFLANR